jgi:hypothetical protein
MECDEPRLFHRGSSRDAAVNGDELPPIVAFTAATASAFAPPIQTRPGSKEGRR